MKGKVKTMHSYPYSSVNIKCMHEGSWLQASGEAGGMCVEVKCWPTCPESILWIQWEPLICLLGRGLGVITDNGKWEMGNATNKRKEKYKVRSRDGHILFIVPCVPRRLGTGHSFIN